MEEYIGIVLFVSYMCEHSVEHVSLIGSAFLSCSDSHDEFKIRATHVGMSNSHRTVAHIFANPFIVFLWLKYE